jgi:hypothetical protein
MAMPFRAISSSAALAAALLLTPAQAEVLRLSYTYVIDGRATVPDPPVMNGFSDLEVFSEAPGGGFDVRSAPIGSPDTVDLNGGMLAVTVAPQPSIWTTTLLDFAGLGL